VGLWNEWIERKIVKFATSDFRIVLDGLTHHQFTIYLHFFKQHHDTI
jgi:hypothetical protein